MTKRDVIGRYKGSIMGLMWSFINPATLLTIYTLVFSIVFKARWGSGEPESKTQFALLLFTGMIIHSLFSEPLMRAPSLITCNVNYVKKIIFPLEILAVVAVGASVFQALVSVLVLAAALFLFNGYIPLTALFLPLVLMPLIIFSLGVTWALSSLGVYLRDVGQPIGLVITFLLFGSPVFYPSSALPDYLQPWLILNPLTFIIEQTRVVMIFGNPPYAFGLLVYSLISLLAAWTGYAWFQKTRRGFGNVL